MGAKVQLDLDFEPGLTQQFPELIDLVAAVIYAHRSGMHDVANALDISPSHLSRILSRSNPDDVRHFDINWLPTVIRVTNDKRPISWLIEKFMQDPETSRKQVLDELAAILPRLNKLAAQAEKEQGTHLKAAS